jgi:hypothetical protein
MRVAVFVRVPGFVAVFVAMDVEFPACDVLAFRAVEVGVELIWEGECGERIGENFLRDAEVAEGGDGHVAGDA